ncbi:carbohydrate kinase family protein, partial [Candidatus Parcubacteria bacterium]
MKKILVSGSLAYDKIMDFPGKFSDHILPDKIHVLSVSFLVNSLKTNFGGTAGNIAYNLSLLNERPSVLATAGSDFLPYRKWLQKNQIDISNVKVIENLFTSSAHIITDQSDNQITAFHPGAGGFSALKKDFGKYDIAIAAPGQQNDMVKVCSICRKKKIPYIFDPGQQMAALSGLQLLQCLNGAEVFISNDYELAMLFKKTGLNEKSLIKKIKVLVTTLGEKGSIIKTQKEIYKIPPAKPKNTSDPTGAGDAFRA